MLRKFLLSLLLWAVMNNASFAKDEDELGWHAQGGYVSGFIAGQLLDLGMSSYSINRLIALKDQLDSMNGGFRADNPEIIGNIDPFVVAIGFQIAFSIMGICSISMPDGPIVGATIWGSLFNLFYNFMCYGFFNRQIANPLNALAATSVDASVNALASVANQVHTSLLYASTSFPIGVAAGLVGFATLMLASRVNTVLCRI